MHNPFPVSTAMDGADFLCFILFLLISIPLLYIPPEHFRIPFLFTAVISTVTSFSVFIWALAKAHGGGPLVSGSAFEIIGVEKARGAALGWAMVYGISSQMGGICAGVGTTFIHNLGEKLTKARSSICQITHDSPSTLEPRSSLKQS
jgi:NCS1 family nucleobase:cation symporter-1